ncbi:MAG: hypothetical protein FWF59_04435 [Turicibacter sp.]|nr:hypothetical protein [Turicibacter sp.]
MANESNQEISFLLRTEGSIVGIMDDEKKVTLPSRTEKITSVYFDRMNPGSGELNLVPLRGESRRFYWTLHPDEFRRPYLNLIFILDDFIWDIRSMPLNRNITFSDYTDGLIKIHRH